VCTPRPIRDPCISVDRPNGSAATRSRQNLRGAGGEATQTRAVLPGSQFEGRRVRPSSRSRQHTPCHGPPRSVHPSTHGRASSDVNPGAAHLSRGARVASPQRRPGAPTGSCDRARTRRPQPRRSRPGHRTPGTDARPRPPSTPGRRRSTPPDGVPPGREPGAPWRSTDRLHVTPARRRGAAGRR